MRDFEITGTMFRGFRSVQPPHLQVANLSSPHNQNSGLSSVESPDPIVSMEGNQEIRSNRWRPTFRSFQPPHLQVTNLSSPHNHDSGLSSVESSDPRVSMEGNQVIRSNRWRPTERQKEILEQLFNQGERNPSRQRANEITNMLKSHGDVQARNISYWFQNSHSRRKRKEQRELMQGLSPQQNVNAGSNQTPTGDGKI